jgi:PadR family transcriptional regulator, regulatory protein PadR
MQIPRLSAKETEILRLLISNGEMYGLGLVAASGNLKRGTVYVTLDRMAEKGYVESRQEQRPSLGGPPRRLFRTTGYGLRVFNAWETARTTFEVEWAV